MADNVVKTCVVCNTGKSNDDFYDKYKECEQCSSKRVLKRYYNKEDNILQNCRDKYAGFKDFVN